MSERRYRPWREKLWSQVSGSRVSEVGVGTGKNLPFYAESLAVTAIDLTPGMLGRAEARAADLGLESRVDFRLGEIQELDFADATFDSAVATFVFCSVPDPVLGLRQLKRVVKPRGPILLLEHVRSANALLGI